MNYRVIGWYTPDYADLANKFSKNLEKYGIPYRLYDVPSVGKWSTQRKPEIVLRAMNDYPDDILVLMDVDCIVHGDISEITKFEGDVGIYLSASIYKDNSSWLAVETSSRVIVFKPTNSAHSFAKRWRQAVTKGHEEQQLLFTLLGSIKDVKFSYIGKKYSGRDTGYVSGAIIEHDSEHAKRSTKEDNWFKWAEKIFLRTGRTKVRKLRSGLGEPGCSK